MPTKNPVFVCGFTTLISLLTGCQQSPQDTREADARALKENETQWNQDFASKDVGKLLAHYADDAVLIASGMPASSGKDAIRRTFTDLVADPALAIKFQASRVEVAKAGDLAWTQGSYTMTLTNPATKQPMNDRGSYVTTYRKQPDGTWKAVADIAASEEPPAAAPAPAAAKGKRARPGRRARR